MPLCAILTMNCIDDFEVYDDLLIAPMAELGWRLENVSWRAKQVNWDRFDAVIIRSPWDYQDDANAFLQVLNQIEQSSSLLLNSLATVKWNIDKHYLQQLEQQGCHIVPTIWHNQFEQQQLTQAFEAFEVEQLVIKPCISANADDTFWLTKSNYLEHSSKLTELFAQRDFMLQPFMPSVIEEGEFSCFYFNGHYSHTILKTPKQDDFRVQEEHGGRLATIENPESELINCADNVLNSIPELPLYARLDFVRHGNSFALMEAELIEPSLYFNMDSKSPMRFAKAFVERMAETQ